jgi:hypothetical protein
MVPAAPPVKRLAIQEKSLNERLGEQRKNPPGK